MRKKTLITGLVVFGLLLVASFAFAKDAWAPDPPEGNVPGELIVGFHPNTRLGHIKAAVSSIGGTVKGHVNYKKGSIVRVRIPVDNPTEVDNAIENLKSNSAFAGMIKYVEPNMVRNAFQVRGGGGDVGILSQSNDPFLGQYQWGYYDIDANRIKAPTNAAGITVAVIDTGVDYTHPDLAGKVLKGKDFVNLDNDPMDDNGHGTHCAGIIGAKSNNNYGVVGVSWNSKILAIKALDFQGSGNSYDVSLAIISAADSAARVISMSLGGGYSSTEDLAVDYAVNTKGKLLIAAAGNGGTNDTTNAYPAALSLTYPNKVIAVAAHDENHCRASFSNYGSWVSVTAPGVGIISTVPLSGENGSPVGFVFMSGTSMATPFVAGAAALAWQKYTGYTNDQIGSMIKTLNSYPRSSLNRDGSCWPADGTGFQKLNVMNLLESEYFDFCDSNQGYIYGYAFDAENGLPLAGAKVTGKSTAGTGTEYVPYFGEFTWLGGAGTVYQGYGLFGVLTGSGDNTLTIQKKGYVTYTPKDEDGLAVKIPVDVCGFSYAGNIPVPPPSGKQAYSLVITWNNGYSTSSVRLVAEIWKSPTEPFPPYNYIYKDGPVPGALSYEPYVKSYWDSEYYRANSIEDPKHYAESIKVAKTMPGWEYYFFADDRLLGAASSWTNGVKAYLYKGKTLLKTYTPPPGPGDYWYICNIVGNTIHDKNIWVNTTPIKYAD